MTKCIQHFWHADFSRRGKSIGCIAGHWASWPHFNIQQFDRLVFLLVPKLEFGNEKEKKSHPTRTTFYSRLARHLAVQVCIEHYPLVLA